MKTLCALIGAFFLLAGIAVLIANLAGRSAPRAGSGSSVSASPATAPPPLVREADAARSRRGAPAGGAVSRQR